MTNIDLKFIGFLLGFGGGALLDHYSQFNFLTLFLVGVTIAMLAEWLESREEKD